jgi:hypothetical protein
MDTSAGGLTAAGGGTGQTSSQFIGHVQASRYELGISTKGVLLKCLIVVTGGYSQPLLCQEWCLRYRFPTVPLGLYE